MVEQLHTMMKDQQSQVPNKQTLTKHELFMRHTALPLVLSMGAVGLVGGVARIDYLNQTEVIGTTTGTVNNGESPKKAIVDGVNSVVNKLGISIDTVSGAEAASQEVTKVVKDATGLPVQPGLYLDIEVKHNNWGNTWVDASPANLAHLNAPEK